MNKSLSRIFAVMLALIMCFSLAVPAFASGSDSNDNGPTTTPDQTGVFMSGTVTLDKNLIMNSNASVPETDFTFTLKPGTIAEPAYPLFNGIMTGVKAGQSEPLSAYVENEDKKLDITVSFTGSEEATDGLPNDSTNSTKKYVTEQFTIDFSEVNFPEAGVYRYVLTEEDLQPPYSVYADTTTYPVYVDVYVEYALQDDGEYANDLSILGVVVHSGANDVTIADGSGVVNSNSGVVTDKLEDLDNEYTTYDLTFEKKVTGNQASKSEYFKFTVKLDSTEFAGTYVVDLSDADAQVTIGDTTYNNYGTNDEGIYTVTFGATDYSVDFYIKHGQSITIKDLPKGAKYTITEVNGDYKASYTVIEEGTGADGADNKLADNQTGAEYKNTNGIKGDTTATFTNTRGGVIPTGILLTVAPFAVLMVIGIVGAIVILKKKNNDC